VRTVSLTPPPITGSSVFQIQPEYVSENLPLLPFASHGAQDALNLAVSPINNP
jgi:hypothetical protein